MMRIGHGYDVHKFGGDGPITIGGVQVAYEQGLLAHSDGDVLLHAICDSILGALALGDIGHHFQIPIQHSGADSRVLLRHVVNLMSQKHYQVGNVDCTIIAQAPKFFSYIESMRNCIASDLK